MIDTVYGVKTIKAEGKMRFKLQTWNIPNDTIVAELLLEP